MKKMRLTQEQFDEYQERRGVVDRLIKVARPKRKASEPNKTELRFESEVLIPWKNTGIIDGYQFHALALIWPDMRYTPDWMVWDYDGQIKLIEVKGPHIHSRDSRVRFLTARRDYPWFQFECWQWKDKQWRDIWK